MKARFVVCSAAAIAALGAVAPAMAQPTTIAVEPGVAVVPAPYPGERIYVPAVRPSGAIHGGAVTEADEQLLSDAVGALSADSQVTGSTVTMVAKNGEVIMNGMAKDVPTAARMERDVRRATGARVTSFFDMPGA